jgi:gamma-glutamyltranspeptidase/glutathione hydrolase
MRLAFMVGAIALMGTGKLAFAENLSPGTWPKDERERIEKLESLTMSPLEAQTVEGAGGIVSATVSPIAVYAGVQTLKHGGTAADAVATVALTQITTQLGSVVSYAGIFTMLYYEASTHRVYSLDAGYNSYLNETDPMSIPVSDLGPLNAGRKPTEGGAKGRETLVPGFMAGIEAMHHRFGRLPFRSLFEPALWYDTHGILISPVLQRFFLMRGRFLSRTPEGQQFMRQAASDRPNAGDLFFQPELAKTLTAVAAQGSRYMYTGRWGQEFVKIIQREGGKVAPEDMERYRPIWSEPYRETVFGHTVYVNGPPHYGAYNLFAGLNMAEALKLNQQGPYWIDPETFRDLARINKVVIGAPFVSKYISEILRSEGIDVSPPALLTKGYAQAVARILDQLSAPPTDNDPKHSNAIVVVDKRGNIAAVTHTINAVIWGDTGIVVGGIPIPDSAAFQQQRLAGMRPGDRVPHEIIDTISFNGGKPVLATGSIGSSLVPENIRVLLGVLGQHQDIATVMSAPPLLLTFDPTGADSTPSQQSVSIPKGVYGEDFIAKVKARGMEVTETPVETSAGLRGTLAAIAIDPKTGKRTAVNQPGVMVFNGAE